MLTAVIAITSLCALFGLGLAWASRRFRIESDPVADQINALLPQTQCAQCGFPGCKPYATAIAGGAADINLCPPGGDALIGELAQLLGRKVKALNPDMGPHLPRRVAIIDEDSCIGCALCVQACPVDAIMGAAGLMHTVIQSECTGCDLCLPPCPVDCIDMAEPSLHRHWRWARPARADLAAVHDAVNP